MLLAHCYIPRIWKVTGMQTYPIILADAGWTLPLWPDQPDLPPGYCEFVCPSKIEIQQILRNGINTMIKEEE